MWQTLGQKDSISIFEKALKAKTLAHAYLIVGPPHIGKMTLAYDLAAALNCTDDNPPCSRCTSCQRILKNIHPDIIYIGLDSGEKTKSQEQKNKKEIGIEEIRNLQQLASLPPYEGIYKIFIINGADELSEEAANCILKTLEEPSPQIILILLASDETRVIPTIVSRCQRIKMSLLPESIIEKILIDKLNVDLDKAILLARLSNGCPGFAISAFGDDEIMSQRQKIIAEFIPLLQCNLDERFSYIARLDAFYRNTETRKMSELFIGIWMNWWHDVMLLKSNCPDNITNLDYVNDLVDYASKLTLQEIKIFIIDMNRSLEQISKNANIRLVLEVLMLDMPYKPLTENN